MIQEAKEIWEFCLADQITLSAEYLRGTLNTKADKASRELKNSSNEWILNKTVFQKLIQSLGSVDASLLASRLCHQISRYIGWQPDPHTWMDAFQINWINLKAYSSTICSNREGVSQSNEDKCTFIIIRPVWLSQQ